MHCFCLQFEILITIQNVKSIDFSEEYFIETQYMFGYFPKMFIGLSGFFPIFVLLSFHLLST